MTCGELRDPASFRDPDGYVLKGGGRVFRALRASGRESYSAYRKSGLADFLEKDGLITRSWEVSREEVAHCDGLGADVEVVIEQERIPFISYPFEWSFDMLKDAAIHTLDVLLLACRYGFVLKDSSAYNVQFRASRPIFIDVLSIKKYAETQPWIGYSQFCQHFLYPLAIHAVKNVPFHHFLRAHLDGIPVQLAVNILGIRAFTGWRMLKHVGLQWLLQRSFGGAMEEVKEGFPGLGFSLKHIVSLATSLRRTIETMHRRKGKSGWCTYQSDRSYETEDIQQKRDFIVKHLELVKPGCVLDLGCNTGEFSLLAASHGCDVIAVDSDEPSVNELYVRCGRMKEERIVPIVMDIMNPSPSLGWELTERLSLFDRVKPDCVFMLALVHHLSIAGNIGWKQLFSLLRRLGSRQVIIEFVPQSDPMVRKLLLNRENVYSWYDEQEFCAEAQRDCAVVERVQLGKSARTLYCLTRRG